MKTLAGRLKNYRYRNGFTQEDIAKALKVNESTVFNWEKGNHSPFPKALDKLDNYLTKSHK